LTGQINTGSYDQDKELSAPGGLEGRMNIPEGEVFLEAWTYLDEASLKIS
jgi:hypothetical protein